jgi:hypothetical protein
MEISYTTESVIHNQEWRVRDYTFYIARKKEIEISYTTESGILRDYGFYIAKNEVLEVEQAT